MTTPAQTPADKVTAQELRATLATIQSRIEQLTERVMTIENIQADERNTLDTLTSAVKTLIYGIQQAATATTTASSFGEMEITTILYNMDKNDKPVYMAMGIPYAKFGVRVWDEVLPRLGIDPATFKAGKNIINPAIRARVLLGETTNRETGAKAVGPHKVTGKA